MTRLCEGRTNPARDAARAEKRERHTVRRGSIPHDVQFTVDYCETSGAWQAFATAGFPSGQVIGFGATPVSAMIAAELEVFKQAKR